MEKKPNNDIICNEQALVSYLVKVGKVYMKRVIVHWKGLRDVRIICRALRKTVYINTAAPPRGRRILRP